MKKYKITQKEIVDDLIAKWSFQLGLGEYKVIWRRLSTKSDLCVGGYFYGIDHLKQTIEISIRTNPEEAIEERVLHELLHGLCAMIRYDFESTFDHLTGQFDPLPDNKPHFSKHQTHYDGGESYPYIVALVEQVKQTSFIKEEKIVRHLTSVLLYNDREKEEALNQVEILQKDVDRLTEKYEPLVEKEIIEEIEGIEVDDEDSLPCVLSPVLESDKTIKEV